MTLAKHFACPERILVSQIILFSVTYQLLILQSNVSILPSVLFFGHFIPAIKEIGSKTEMAEFH